MQTVDTQVDSRALTSLYHLVLQLFLHLGNHLLDTGGVDTTVGHQLVQGQTTHLTTNRVEGRDHDGLRRIVHHDFHAGGSLEGTDVTTLTTDDASFHLIVLDMEHAHRVLHGCFRCHALDGLDDDLLSLCVRIQLRLVHDLVDIAGSIRAGLVLQTLHQTCLRLLGTQSAQLLQFLTFLQAHLLQFVLLHLQQFLLVIHALLLLFHILFLPSQLFLTLVQTDLTLFQSVLVLLDLLVTGLHLFLQFGLFVQELVLHLQ